MEMKLRRRQPLTEAEERSHAEKSSQHRCDGDVIIAPRTANKQLATWRLSPRLRIKPPKRQKAGSYRESGYPFKFVEEKF